MTKKYTAQKYLEEHGIENDIVEMFELSWDDNYLHIPVKDEEGNDLFIKSRYLHYKEGGNEPKYKNSAGSHATLFNFYSVKDESSIVLTEGELDAMKLMQEGIPAISSTGGAGTFPEEFAESLKDKKIWICYDNDPAGQQGLLNVLQYLPKSRIVLLPEGVKDVCEFFQSNEREDFLKLMKLAPTRVEWLAANIPDEYKLISGKEINEMKVQKVPFIIDSIIYKDGFCFIYGAEGIGKSFIALSLAIAAASGNSWLDVFKVKNKVNVLYLDKENPISRTVKRVKGLGGAPENLYWLKSPAKFTLHNGKGGLSDFALALTTLIEEKKIGLIVIDSFVDLMVGSESSAEDTQRFFSALRQLFPNIALLVLHHENKPSQGVYRNSSQRLRGSTNINAQTDTMFRLETVMKSKVELTLEQTKNRDEEKLDKFMIRMEVESNPDEEGKTIVTGFTYMGIVTGNADDKKAEEAEELIREALSDAIGAQLNRQDLIAITNSGGVSRSTLDRVLKDMEENKAIKKERKGKQTWFTLLEPIVGGENLDGGLF